MKNGARPCLPDARDLSFRKTFGAVPVDPAAVPDFNLHYGPVPDQNAPNPDFGLPAYPYGCTDYSTAGVATDEDQVRYNPGFTESLTGANAKGGYDVRLSLLTSVDTGLQALGEGPELAGTHKRPQLFRVGANPDFFRGILTAMATTKRPVSMGTPWFLSWSSPAADGTLFTDLSENVRLLGWHNWVVCGKKTVNGRPMLVAEMHAGPGYGDGGFAYLSADDVNAVMRIQYTCAFTVAKAEPASVQTVGLGYLLLKNLVYGDVGDAVSGLQRALQYLGYPIPDAVTRVYGTETRAAVAAFQADHYIRDDGTHCGPLTRFQVNRMLNPGQNLVGQLLLLGRTIAGV